MEYGLIGGLIALSVTGFSWSLTGIVMSSAPRKGVDSSLVLLFGAFVAMSIMAIWIVIERPPFRLEMIFPAAIYIVGGIFNFALLQLMSIAMQKGPNGVIWGIVQSGIIWPFMTGVIFFDVILTPTRGCGMVLLLIALALFGKAKPQGAAAHTHDHKWLILAFIAFVCCGIQQTLSNMPSYFESVRNISPLYRSMSARGGLVLGVLFYNLYRRIFHGFRLHISQLARPALWGYVVMIQGFSLISGYFLFYPGQDALARAGIGSASYPLLVSACLIGFFLYSTLVLREKNHPIQYIAFFCCLSGIIMICVQVDILGNLFRWCRELFNSNVVTAAITYLLN